MVGFRTLERLAGIDDQGAGKHHLSQAEGGTQGKTLEDDHLQVAELETLTIKIIEKTYQGANGDDGSHADLITTVVLYQKGYKHAQRKESEAERGHGDASLYGREFLFHQEPVGQRGHQQIDRHRQQEVGDGHQPEVAMPEADMDRRALGIHFKWRIGN